MLIPFIIPFLVAMFLSINMGASGTAPAFSAAYGSKIIKESLIPGLFGLAVFAGAIIGGKETAKTIGSGLLSPELMSFSVVSVILFSVAISLLLANIMGIPQSTSQSTVTAVVAPAIYFNSFDSHKLFYEILPTWFIMPVLSFILAYCIGKYIYKPLRRRGYTISSKLNQSPYIKALVLIMSMYVAFSIGTNNVANAVGPITTMAFNELNIASSNFVQVMILGTLIVAPCFGIGSSIMGNKVLRNTGKEIVMFGRIEAAIIAFLSASLLLVASLIKGIPTSLVQLNVAAIIGIGIAKLGHRNILRKTEVKRFFIMWMISPCISFALSLSLIYIFDYYQIFKIY